MKTSAGDNAAALVSEAVYIVYGILRLNFHGVLNNKIMTALHEGAVSKHNIMDWNSLIVLLLHHGGIQENERAAVVVPTHYDIRSPRE